MRCLCFRPAAMLLLVAAMPVAAQRAAPVAVAAGEAVRLGGAQRAAAVAAISVAIQRQYVFPQRVPAITARLQAGLASGRYDLEDPRAFAARVTDDLRAASGDRHVYLNYAPDEYAATLAAERPGGVGDTSAVDALRAHQAARANHGLAELRILPGNIRYLRITGFQWIDDQTGAVYDDAMRFLRGGDALIIDLRNNGGGSHAAVRYLLSHFMDGDRLDITFLRSGAEPEQSRTLEYLPAGRLKRQPLYILVNDQVGSAAEAFAYDVKQFKLGTLVGTTTAGAANNNGFTPVAPGFMLSVSFGRPVHPVSGTNWEGVGVPPDVSADFDRALPAAQALALQRLMARADASPGDQADWRWALPAVEAQLHPVSIPAARLAALAGIYGGRKIVQREGALYFERRIGISSRLLPLTEDGWFAVDGYDDRFRIRLTGSTMETQWIDEPAPTKLVRDAPAILR